MLGNRVGLRWSSGTGGMLEIQGKWKLTVYSGFRMTFKGTFESKVYDARTLTSVKFVPKDGHPQVLLADQDMSVKVRTRWHGAGDSIIRMFSGTFASGLQTRLQPTVYGALNELLNEINAQLRATPLRIPLRNKYFFDYSFDEVPRAGSDFLQFGISANVVHGNFVCPIPPKAISEVDDKGHQLNFWISDQLLDCWLASVHADKTLFFDYLITKEQEPQYLKTDNCTLMNTCIGEFFPGLQKLIPNGYVDMRIYSSQAPTVHLEKNSVILQGYFNIDFHAASFKDHRKPLIRLARLTMTNVRLVGVSSAVGPITTDFLMPFEGLLNHMTGNTTLEKAVNATLWNGVALPTFLGLSFAPGTSEIVADQDVLRFHSNFAYQMKKEKAKKKMNNRKSRKNKHRSILELLFMCLP